MAEEQAVMENGDVKSSSKETVKLAPSPMPGIPIFLHNLTSLLTTYRSAPSLNARDMEMAVWLLPDQTKDAPELPDLLEIMQKYWEEHMISKLAIPEVSLSPAYHFA